MVNNKVYALYKGEKFRAVGTLDEISDETGISVSSLLVYKAPSRHEMIEMGANWSALYLVE